MPVVEERLNLPRGRDACESWSFEAVSGSGEGMLVRWTVWPERDLGSYWAYLTYPDTSVVAVRDDEVRPPQGRTLEVRADGLWAEGVCEIRNEHWSLALEAFAVRLETALDGWAGELGERIPFGFELDWERESEAVAVSGGYAQGGRLWGEVVVGRETRPFDGRGVRIHRCVDGSRTSGWSELRCSGPHGPLVREVAIAPTQTRLPTHYVIDEQRFDVRSGVFFESGAARCLLVAGVYTAGGEKAPGWIEAIE